MKTTPTHLRELVRTELQETLRENYLHKQLLTVLEEQETAVSTATMEGLLEDVIEALAGIDMSIDYLTAAITGDDPYSISIAQRTVGRGAMVTKAQPDVTEGVQGGQAPEAHHDLDPEDDYPELEWPEDSEEGDLRADARLGGDWQGGAIDDEPAPRRPPKEHRRQAIKILASFNLDVGQQAIDILAWELYNKAHSATTQDMDEPVGKGPWWRRVLNKAIGEDLKAGMKKPLLNEITKQELSAVRYFTKGQPYEMEKMLIQLMDRYGFELTDVEQLAKELGRMDPEDLQQQPDMMQYVKEEMDAYLGEVYSKKQRDYMCAMKDASAEERPDGLSQGEAGHLCSAPMEKPKSKRKKK